ncbi:peptidoglycan-binding domain-containing protein [Aeromicrobium wangtongii]|uniref:peptidoglycan-binding domain-containing protein n=1 Tax=Aeromicrobium wangtongii TaxID=2969247 RepID=UPI0020178729|nr:peptidoglycan-binding protein [Aeromicrobium wangtongii]MCL3817508.1 peptidoglycan-binding protein [Aeromicrobium wangtongii]
MRKVWIVAVALALGLTASPARAAAGKPPIPLPSAPTGLASPVALPQVVDAVPAYQPQVSCHPGDMIGPIMLRDLVLATYGIGGRGNISRGCTEGVSEHSEGRAWDWAVNVKNPAEQAAAADFIAWLTRDDGLNARRLGVMYVIYNKKIWGAYNTRAGWRTSYAHTDHVHISFSWNGARGNTSFWTGTAGTIDHGPCARFKGSYAAPTSAPRAARCGAPTTALVKTSRPNRQYGSTGGTVARLQTLLGVPVTRRFDTATQAAVRSYQRAHDLPVTGAADQPTWASLDRSSIKKRTVRGFTAWKAANHGRKHYSRNTISQGRAAKAVVILQTALGMRVADRNGYFGPLTQAAVMKVQAKAGLVPDGVVRAEEWQAIR